MQFMFRHPFVQFTFLKESPNLKGNERIEIFEFGWEIIKFLRVGGCQSTRWNLQLPHWLYSNPGPWYLKASTLQLGYGALVSRPPRPLFCAVRIGMKISLMAFWCCFNKVCENILYNWEKHTLSFCHKIKRPCIIRDNLCMKLHQDNNVYESLVWKINLFELKLGIYSAYKQT